MATATDLRDHLPCERHQGCNQPAHWMTDEGLWVCERHCLEHLGYSGNTATAICDDEPVIAVDGQIVRAA